MPAVAARSWGVFQPVSRVGNTYPDTMPRFAGQVGRWPDLFVSFIDLVHDFPGKPGSTAPHTEITNAVVRDGQGLFLAFQPIKSYSYDGTTNPTTGNPNYPPRWATFAEIIAGVYDAQITAILTYYASLTLPGGGLPTLMLRPIWEGNIYDSFWFPADSPNKPASKQATGTAGTGFPVTPGRVWTNDAGDPVCASVAEYIACFRHIHALAKAVSSRWQVAYIPGNTDGRAEMNRGAAGVTAVNEYPGDAYCDVVGFDIYNGLQSRWTTPLETLRGIRLNDQPDAVRAEGAQTGYAYAYDMFQAIAPAKPIAIGEIGCAEPGDPLGSPSWGAGESKAAWLTELLGLGTSVLPALTTICYFNSPGTRRTYPVTSSSSTFEAFAAGFSSAGRAAPPWEPADGDAAAPPDPSDKLVDDIIPRSGGLFRRLNQIRWAIRRVIYWGSSGLLALRGASDGSVSALRVTTDMGTLPVGQYIPAIDAQMPAPVGGVRKFVLSVKEAGESGARWFVRSDGRVAWANGTDSADLNLERESAAKLRVTGASGAAATLAVAAVEASTATLAATTTPASPGGSAAVLYVRDGVVWARTAGGDVRLGRSQAVAAYGDLDGPYDLALAPGVGGSAGPQMTAGQALCALVEVTSARALTRLALTMQAVGTGIAGAYAAAYSTSGALLIASTDQASAWATTGYKAMTGGGLATTSTLTAGPQSVWVLAWADSLTGTFRIAGLTNTAASGPAKRFGTLAVAAGGPPSTITVGSIVASGNAPWLGVG